MRQNMPCTGFWRPSEIIWCTYTNRQFQYMCRTASVNRVATIIHAQAVRSPAGQRPWGAGGRYGGRAPIKRRQRRSRYGGRAPIKSRRQLAAAVFEPPGEKTRKPRRHRLRGFRKAAAAYSPTWCSSTIGASELNFSVRYGKRWILTAITTAVYYLRETRGKRISLRKDFGRLVQVD